VSGASTEFAFVSRFLNQIFVLFRIIDMIAIRHKIAQMLGVFVTFAFGVGFGML
jgi:hypothetical protein